MWMDGQRTKTNPKTSPEQSAIFQLVREINKTNVLTKFHDDLAKHVTSIVKTPPPPWRPYIYKTNLFTKFHDDWAKNVTSRVHVIQLTGTIFELNSCIKETNVLTKLHENWAKNVTSRVFTCFHCIHIEKNALPTGGHVFSSIWTIFELSQDINITNVLTSFHNDWAKIVTSSVFTRKTAPPTGSHVFQRTRTTFELNQHIINTNILTNFEINRDIIRTNVLTKLNKDWTKNVASRVFTRKTAPPTDGHVFQRTRTTFELNQHIIKTNILTMFHEDWA
ncbi:hypothetical protein DPMN_017071 [Dreissena polymorpha]|uniref:Uncharacterized protein n=1 Tax=Dreissena polymorpha TaxID=45954 RepID=A0A9D4S700_DREPO|nr:hypothetical protein DPMN_017071 [Dreissena polymorpha]